MFPVSSYFTRVLLRGTSNVIPSFLLFPVRGTLSTPRYSNSLTRSQETEGTGRIVVPLPLTSTRDGRGPRKRGGGGRKRNTLKGKRKEREGGGLGAQEFDPVSK